MRLIARCPGCVPSVGWAAELAPDDVLVLAPVFLRRLE